MQFMLLIYQGSGWDAIGSMSDEEKQAIGAEYGGVLATPGVTPGPPLGLPQDATTVRIENGETIRNAGPYIDVHAAVGGSMLFEADSLDDAVDLAARIPAARLGGAVEVRPVGSYW
jgi:hypothetical protein